MDAFRWSNEKGEAQSDMLMQEKMMQTPMLIEFLPRARPANLRSRICSGVVPALAYTSPNVKIIFGQSEGRVRPTSSRTNPIVSCK